MHKRVCEPGAMKRIVSSRCKTFGFTEEEVAQRIGISSRSLRNYYKNPASMRIEVADRLCMQLKINFDELLGCKKC